MTGFKSKKTAALDKLEQWDTPSEAFNAWWNNDYDDSTNPFEVDTFGYWAWAGWQAALAQPATVQIDSCIEAADSKWADADVPVEWARHFAKVIAEALAQPEQNHREVVLNMVAQPAQKPDVVMHWNSHTWTINNPPPKGSGDVNLYYTPPQREWVDLTEKQIEVIEEKALTKQWAIRMALAAMKDRNA